MSYKILQIKLRIVRCNIKLKLLDAVKAICDAALNPRVFSIVMKIGGVCYILSGIEVIARRYANPIGAAITYFFLGYLFFIVKSSKAGDST